MSRTLADMTPTELGGSMTDHADTLRGMARALRMGLHPERDDTYLAGADALDTLKKVRVAVEQIDRLEDDAQSEWERSSDTYRQGQADAYSDAFSLITDALGDTHE